MALEYIESKPQEVALRGGTGTGVGTADPAPSVGGLVMTGVGTEEPAPSVGMRVGFAVGVVEGAPAATITHVCVEYALVLSKHELPAHDVAAHVALKGTVIVVDVPVQVALDPY